MKKIIIALIIGFIAGRYTEAWTLSMVIADIQYYLSVFLESRLMVGG